MNTLINNRQAFVPMTTSFYNKLTAGGFDQETNVDALVDQLINDLDDLLNARQACLPNQQFGLENTVLGYGMCDLSTFNPESTADQEKLCRYVQGLIENFEPRLRNVQVSLAGGDKFSFNFKLAITATYRLENDCLNLAFNSIFLPQASQFDINGVRYD